MKVLNFFYQKNKNINKPSSIFPVAGLADVILAKAKSNWKIAGGAAGGSLGLFVILVCMCVVTCRYELIISVLH